MKYFFLLLLFSFLCFGDLSAQVGINNSNPSQALDVGGKIKVGDDEIAPVAGTIRYNRVSKTFEGYDGTEWSVFNPEPDDDGGSGSSDPMSGDLLWAEINVYSISSNTIRVDWYYGPNSWDKFDKLPDGKRLRITSIVAAPGDVSSHYEFRFISNNNFGIPLPDGNVNFSGNLYRHPGHVVDPLGQVLVVPAGGSVSFYYNNFKGTVRITGYLE